jgi:hypothetical protein
MVRSPKKIMALISHYLSQQALWDALGTILNAKKNY